MRFLVIGVSLLAALSPVVSHAGTIESISFSGTWANTAGIIQAGDAFSGTATWDDSSVTTPYPFCPAPCTSAPLLSLSFVMPSAEGLSFGDVLSPQINGLHDGPHVVAYSSGSFTDGFIEFWDTSTVDGNIYEFTFRSTITNTDVGIADFPTGPTGSTAPSSYNFVGPVASPEPGTATLSAASLTLLVIFLLCRKVTERRIAV